MSIRLTIPENKTGLAFIEHGFTGDKNERHMQILEEELSNHGYFVVNIDATNSLNESDSSPEGASFTGHYNDLVDVIEWARGQKFNNRFYWPVIRWARQLFYFTPKIIRILSIFCCRFLFHG
ncbi:MAG: hypothetical protein LBU87_07030 [Lactobacillales bacterium]|jgi:predicted alpha/beta-fold hydrolase|nr:hypothetical protein [Lactobacillales bacterium]